MSGRRARAARQHARRFPNLEFPDGLIPNLPLDFGNLGFAENPPRYLINDGGTHPNVGSMRNQVAVQPAKGPYGRRWRVFYYLTDPNGHNRKDRRAARNWSRQIEVAGTRAACEGRLTKAYGSFVDGLDSGIAEVDLDELHDNRA